MGEGINTNEIRYMHTTQRGQGKYLWTGKGGEKCKETPS